MSDAKPIMIHLKDYTVPEFLIDDVDLHFLLEEGVTTVTTTLAMRRNPESDHDGDLVLHGEELELKSVALNGDELPAERYIISDKTLTVRELSDSFKLKTIVTIDPASNTALEGLYQSSGNYCTQCEAQGFRKITYYLDRPDVMSKFTTTVEGDKTKYPVLLSNGNPIARGESENGRHWVKWEDPHRKPAYLFALVAGDLTLNKDTFTTASGREVALEFYTEAHNADKTDHAMESLKRAMRWDEERFGLEYDLDIYMIVAVDDFNMGAMENKGLNIFNSRLVFALPETATDSDYVSIEAVIGHEYFHNWTGNRVTCRDWFQLSLKEGLTVYRDEEFTADMTSAGVKRIDDVRLLRTHQFPEDTSPMAHPIRPASFIEINNFYTVTVYEKGAEIVRLYETLLGRDGFRKGMDLYFERHDGQAVTTDDFRAAMADANGVDLSCLQRWYEQAGTPTLDARDSWNAEKQEYTLTLKQSCRPTPEKQNKEPFPIPVRMGLLAENGSEIPLHLVGDDAVENEKVLLLKDAEQTFVFKNVSEKPTPSLLRAFSAPVQLNYEWSDAQLAFLMANDVDSFNRWEAGQTLATRVMLSLIDARANGREMKMNDALLNAFGALLSSDTSDAASLAEALRLPDETYLAEQMEVIDVDGIHVAREFLKTELANAFTEDWRRLYNENQTDGEYSPDAESMGKRRLKNLALGYLVQGGDTELAYSQYQEAANMTDSFAALATLTHAGGEGKEKALSHFEERWQHDSLVMNKWFQVQATAPLSDAVTRVESLLSHPGYSLRNPNKVRALLNAFAQANPTGFHIEDGSGYRLIADKIIELDGFNPQTASRLCKTLSRWKRYDSKRGARMKAELERIKSHEGLSSDVFEVVERSLG